ncbi:MAG: hypothetical protein QM278_11830 [Pseudomonadota bacterium]|nr:hypothetical protein [Pseudomonadota bacterium]
MVSLGQLPEILAAAICGAAERGRKPPDGEFGIVRPLKNDDADPPEVISVEDKCLESKMFWKQVLVEASGRRGFSKPSVFDSFLGPSCLGAADLMSFAIDSRFLLFKRCTGTSDVPRRG